MPPAKKSPPPKTGASPPTKDSPPAKSGVPLPLQSASPEKMREPTARLGTGGQDSKRGGKDSSRGGKPKMAAAAAAAKLSGGAKKGKLGAVVEDEEMRKPTPSQGGQLKPDENFKIITTASGIQKKIEYLSEELMNRKPLDAKLRDALVKKCGPPVQEVNFLRNEAKPPLGRQDDLAPSRHERVPPCRIVLMFNCFEASFTLLHGDIATLPESEMCELRSLTSAKIMGRVRLSPEKGTPIEERIMFVDTWFVGSEHGLVHDGLQADGYIELRLDWRDTHDNPRVALIKVIPWLAYGCGEGARLGVRKPGATEGTSSTVQRTLRDDHVVVKRDGTDNELTVDPTPFTVVPSSNPRHPVGTRLLILYEGGCVDAVVDVWPEAELDIKEGSRHHLKVEGKLISGWITTQTIDGQVNLNLVEGQEEDIEDEKKVWVLNRKKMLAMHSGCDPTNSEKIGSLSNKMPVRILETRETEDKGTRAYVSTIPAQSSIMITIALNEFNHSVQRFPSVAEYEAARANYCEDIVVREALVEDAITGNNLRIKDQTLHISTATDAVDNARPIPAEWNVSNVLDLVKLLLVSSPNRANGSHSTQPVLVRAGPGTGKTWMAKQAVFTLADKLLRGSGSNDGIRLVPIVVFVQRIIYLLREGDKPQTLTDGSRQQTLLERYIESVYSGKKYEAWCTMLMQAYDMRALIVLLDGVDEAAGLRDQIEDFVHREVVPSGNRVLVTSRPEGVQLSTYSKTFVVMNLNPLTNEQQRRVINIQMEGNQFFDHLLSLGEARKNLDDAYRKIGAVVRNELETLWGTNSWQYLVDGKPIFDPAQRQKEHLGLRIVAPVKKLSSAFLLKLDELMRSSDNDAKINLLDRLDIACNKFDTYIEDEFEEAALEGMGDPDLLQNQIAVKLGKVILFEKEQAAREAAAAAAQDPKKANAKKAAKLADQAKAEAKAAEAKPAPEAGAPAAEGVVAEEGEEEEELHPVAALWKDICLRTDEIYVVHEKMNERYRAMMEKLVVEVARDDEEAKKLVKDIRYVPFKDPVRLYEKARDTAAGRFDDDEIPESCISDVTRSRISLQTGTQIKDLVNRLTGGISLTAEQLKPVKPSERAAQAEADEAAAAAGVQPGLPVVEIKCMYLDNRFDHLDPTHFRFAVCELEITEKMGVNLVQLYCEVEVHYMEILQIGAANKGNADEHYNFFRKRLKGTVPEVELDRLLEEKLVFLVDATGIPVLLSLLVLIFTSGGEDLNKLPSNRIELYEIGIESAIAKRLLPGGRTSTDLLIHDWLRLFNLDRSAMTAAVTGVGTEKKEREHRPTRKAALSMELSTELNEKKLEAESAAANKKKASEQGANKGDKKLLNLDAKEVYEVFRHGAHYLREAAKPEVQRTELNRIELSMPKKLVDTVMMLVNANLKMLLGGRAQALGLTMLRHVAVSNQLSGRREFSAVHVAQALLIDQVNTEGMTLWLHLNKEEAGLPLTKTLEAQTEIAPAQYQFKHLSFQEGLFAQDLLLKAEAGWETWETDVTASEFLNNPFMNNTCRIAAGYLGSRLAKRRPTWDFSKKETRLSEVGLQALWLICENNEKIKTLDLRNNGVGTKAEDGIGLSRMLSTSTALGSLDLGNNVLGDLKGYIRTFGRGLSSNKTLSQLDVSSNKLLPEGIKVVCNALRTCTGMKDLNLSYNSPGREPALAGLLQMHPTLRSVGVVEKEPTTRSERTFWLDTRAKEAIGRALLSSTTVTIQYCQCDVFSLTETTETLAWTSKANCDAIVLAGVLRSNSVLKTLNCMASQGEIGDYEREEIGMALISNTKGKVGYSDIYGLKEGMNPTHRVDLKDKDHIRSRRSFTLFAGLLRANTTLTNLTLASVVPEHIDVLADALATNGCMKELILEQPSKTADTAYATLPVQQLNGTLAVDSIDLFDAGGDQPVHKIACAVVGAILGAPMRPNTTIRRLKINPGGGSEGGAILDHLHRARKSSLTVLDLTNIGLADRGGTRFFESMLAAKSPMLKSLHLGSNRLTDLAVGQLIVEVLRADTCNISTLDLHDNPLGAPVIVQSMKYNKSLTSLDIRDNPIEDEGLLSIGNLLLEKDCTCHLNSILCKPFDILYGSDQISIHFPELGSGATKLMFGVLKYNELIKVLNLKNRGIETAAAEILATAVKHNKTLQSIDLSGNPLTDVTLYVGTKPASDTKGLLALANAVQKSSSIEAITLEGGTLPVDQLRGDKKVRVLDLSRKNLSFISALMMGTLLSGNTFMNELIVHTNDLTPNGVKFIVKHLSTTLKTLDIANVVRVEERSKGDKKGDKRATNTSQKADIPPEELQEMWSAISELNWLEKLTLDRDHLAALPNLGKLLAMKTLSISNNKLTTLPTDINLIRGLKSLTLHGNQLYELNAAVGDIDGLEKLDLRSNKLLYLPTTISKLRNLKQLDVSENLLQTLDPSICDLHTIERAEFKDNPLVRPPQAICRQGIGAIRKFFQEIVTSADIKTHGAKMVLIGHAESGKTTLQQSIRSLIASVPLKTTLAYESTNHVDVGILPMGEQATQVMLSVWDLAGLRSHGPSIQQYITDGSFYVLCVPALDMALLKNNYTDYIGRWLGYLKLRCPTAVVIPCLTKCDQIKGGAKELNPAALENNVANQLAWYNECLDSFDKLHEGTKRPRIQRPIQCVAAVPGGEPSIEAVKGRIEAVLFSEPRVLPQVGQNVSRNTFLTTVFVHALRDGREPIDSARAADIGYIPSTMSTELKLAPRPFVQLTEITKMYLDEFCPALKLSGADDRTLAETLKLLESVGEVVTGPGGLIFLERTYLTRMLKPLTDPKMGNRLWLNRTLALQDAHRSLSGRPPLTELERLCVASAAEALEKQAEVREELLLMLWETLPVKRDDFGKMATILSAAGCMYLSANSHSGRRWVMPMRCPFIKQDEIKETWNLSLVENAKVLGEAVEVLKATISVGAIRPTGVLEVLMSEIGGLGNYKQAWPDGAHIEMKALPGITDLLLELKATSRSVASPDGSTTMQPDHEVTIECCGPKILRPKCWVSLMHIKSLAQRVINDIPGLSDGVRTMLCCPGCLSSKEPEPTTWVLEDVAARAKTCEKCGENLSLQSVTLGEVKPPLPLLIDPPSTAPKEPKYCGDKLRLGRPMETFFGLGTLLGLQQEEVDKLRAGGENSIIDEIVAAQDVPRSKTNANGPPWSDLDWLRYLAGPVVESRVQLYVVAGGGKALDDDVVAKNAAEKQEALRKQAKEFGIDEGRENVDLNVFLKPPACALAGLNRAHMLALRLYTSRVGAKINLALHDGCSPERRHPYAALIVLLNDAVWKLRGAQIEHKRNSQKKAAALFDAAKKAREEGDEEKAVQCLDEGKEAEKYAKSLECNLYYSSVNGLNQVEFKQRGATETGFMSVSKLRQTALEPIIAIQRVVSAANAKAAVGPNDDGESEEDMLYLPLAPDWKLRPAVVEALPPTPPPAASPSKGKKEEEEEEGVTKFKKPPEIPILMFKLVVNNDAQQPTDLSAISPFPAEQECVYAPGVLLDMGKTTTEFMDLGPEFDSVQHKAVEVSPTLGRNLSGAKGLSKGGQASEM